MKLFNKKKILLPLGIVLTVLLTSCGSKELTEENAQAIVENFLQDFKQYKYTDMYALTHDAHPYFQGMYDESVPSKVALFNGLSDGLEYEITGVVVDGKEAVVNTHVSNVDAQAVVSKATEQYVNTLTEMEESEAENTDMDALLSKILAQNADDPDAERIQKDTVFNLVEQNGEWKIESNILIYDDITGGYVIPYTWNNIQAVG